MENQKLIDKHYPAMSEKRKALRKNWNKCQVLDWHQFLESSAIGEESLIQFRELAKKCKNVSDFIIKAQAIQVPSEVSEHFRRQYSHSPFETIEIVTKRFFDKYK